jgi:hypothetical protein
MSVAESRKTKADFEREIATLRARIKEKEALMNRSGGVRQRIANIESRALQRLVKELIEQSRFAPDN